MKIRFNGAAQTVTGSQHLLEINDKKILLDCGLFQGHRQDFYDRNLTFDFDPRTIDAVLLSHAHIDHSGNLPNLVKMGYSGPIYATPPTSALGEIMLADAAHIQEADAEYANKKNARRGEPPVEPLYTLEDATAASKLYYPVQYGQAFSPVPDVTVRFVDAGHILGSAAIVLNINDNGIMKKLWFSGDIGRFDMPLLRDPILPDNDVDFLLMECTYGDMPHPSIEAAYQEFKEIIIRTVNRGGKIIIPAFAVGRTQDIVYFMNRMISESAIRPIPVYVDSPLAVNASKIFLQFPDYFDEETRQLMLAHRHPALDFAGLTYVGSVEESKKLNDMKGPMVIISASGMAETGRILHHLRNNIENPANTILIVGWQAPNTLGRRLADGDKQVRIFGQLFERRAEVTKIDGLSAHAGQDMLLRYARQVKGHAKKIILVHGEPDKAAIFEGKLTAEGIGPVYYPQWQETVEI
ncbi:MAG: MBL fold metallo-hydrolase RNA specificity domain-containing protein [Anaerolineaceae bacterium]